MKALWRDIKEYDLGYSDPVLVHAPDLVDEDFNPTGVETATLWDHHPITGEDGDTWVSTAWDNHQDIPVSVACNPTHFMLLEAPNG